MSINSKRATELGVRAEKAKQPHMTLPGDLSGWEGEVVCEQQLCLPRVDLGCIGICH